MAEKALIAIILGVAVYFNCTLVIWPELRNLWRSRNVFTDKDSSHE